MADRIAVMDQGRIAQVATPGEIYEQPRTRFIAEFVGEVNILDGRVRGQQNGLWTVGCASAQAALIIDDADEVLHEGQSVAIAVRPEKMLIHREKPAPGSPMCSPARCGISGIWATGQSIASSSPPERFARVASQQIPFRGKSHRMGRAGLRHVRARRGNHSGGIGDDPRPSQTNAECPRAGAAVPVARHILSRAVCDRSEDQPV